MPFWSSQTHFVGWSERHPRWEMREASLVNTDWFIEAWAETEQDWLVVHDRPSLALFLRRGGHALVEKGFAETHLADVIRAHECVHDADIQVGGFGFLGTDHFSDEAIERRAPSRALRMQVLKRDNYRCVICGRRAKDHIDLELHVHHLIPHRMDGPTAEENLVTLCGTCHKGLAPDYQPILRELAGLPGRANPLDHRHTEFDEEVARYRQWVARQLSDHDGESTHDHPTERPR
ncbi:HNH endonuclease [Mycolicibacterium porcinum]|uniref:HNH endonuclease n=1 Tax=Mycolicibacterium porcinum TaxID=39693 RepID=UPI00256F2AA6|nr:HNH endonuclease [Mycolicibacterium porcinum]